MKPFVLYDLINNTEQVILGRNGLHYIIRRF